jgi:hypothetical protein
MVGRSARPFSIHLPSISARTTPRREFVDIGSHTSSGTLGSTRNCHGNFDGMAPRQAGVSGSANCRGLLRVCPKQAQDAAGEQMTLDREGVVNRGVHAEEALS